MEYKLTSKAYNEALKQNKLLGLKCKDCGTITIPPKMACSKCGSYNMEIVELKGSGKIKTFTVVNVAAEGREPECPYIIAMVELDEGPWLMGNLAGVEPEKATYDAVMGKRVKMGSIRVFPGDKFSAGEGARVMFSFAG